MTSLWLKPGRLGAAALALTAAWACTVEDKSGYTFTDNPSEAGQSNGAASGKGGSGGTGGTAAAGGTGGSKAGAAGKPGTGGTGGGSGEAGEGGAAGATGGTGGSSGKGGKGGKGGTGGTGGGMGNSGAGQGGAPSECGNGDVEGDEECDNGDNNGVTACTYGKHSCTVCTEDCKEAPGKATYCGDNKKQSSHEECDDGNTVTEGCDYGDSECTACDSTCHPSSTRSCGDHAVNGDTVTSIDLDFVGVLISCTTTSLGVDMPFYLNGVAIPNVPQSSCSCSSSVTSITITDTSVLTALRPRENVLEARQDYYTPALGWVRLTFHFDSGESVKVVPLDNGFESTNTPDLCETTVYTYGAWQSARFSVPVVEQCDSGTGCDRCAELEAVPDFTGEPGPFFPGWTQCAGYLDTEAGDELPSSGWAEKCKGDGTTNVRLVCGADRTSYRYLDLNKNIFRDGVIGYPDTTLIADSRDQDNVAFSTYSNEVYASSPVDSYTTWWGTNQGCTEDNAGLSVNNYVCTWEVSDCFGQNLTGDRHLWVYVK